MKLPQLIIQPNCRQLIWVTQEMLRRIIYDSQEGMSRHALSSTAESKAMSQCLLLTTPSPVLGWHTFLPEDFRIPGQHCLQKHRHVALRVVIPQVVLQLSGMQGEEGSQRVIYTLHKIVGHYAFSP